VKARDRRAKAGGLAAIQYFLLAALQDFALYVHLPQPTLGVRERRGKDEDVVDALARLRADAEPISNHGVPPSHIVRATLLLVRGLARKIVIIDQLPRASTLF